MKKLFTAVALLLALGIPASAKQIDGKVNPELIPDSVAWRGLFWMVYAAPDASDTQKAGVKAYIKTLNLYPEEVITLMNAAAAFVAEFNKAAKNLDTKAPKRLADKYAAPFLNNERIASHVQGIKRITTMEEGEE